MWHLLYINLCSLALSLAGFIECTSTGWWLHNLSPKLFMFLKTMLLMCLSCSFPHWWEIISRSIKASWQIRKFKIESNQLDLVGWPWSELQREFWPSLWIEVQSWLCWPSPQGFWKPPLRILTTHVYVINRLCHCVIISLKLINSSFSSEMMAFHSVSLRTFVQETYDAHTISDRIYDSEMSGSLYFGYKAG